MPIAANWICGSTYETFSTRKEAMLFLTSGSAQSAITHRIALGPQQGRKVFKRQTLPTCADDLPSAVGKEAGFSLHAGVAPRAHERDKVERLCRYVSRPPVAEPRLSLTSNGEIRYRLKTPYRDGTTHAIFQPLDLDGAHPCAPPCGRPAVVQIGCPADLFGAPCSAGAAPACKPDSILRSVRTKQSVSSAGDAVGAGQRECCCRRRADRCCQRQ